MSIVTQPKFSLSGVVLACLIAFYVISSSPLAAQGSSSMTEPSPVAGVNFSQITVNGLNFRIAVAGDSGPLMLLAHGWPESWYNWRHQLQFFSQRGYRVVAPDMRGYGSTDAPDAVEAYDIKTLAADMVGILDTLGEERAIMVGHDWGSIVAWNTVLMYPDRFSGLIAMSVPYSGRPEQSPLVSWREAFADNFYYILYHNEPEGVAEAEYDNNPYGLISRLYLSPDSPRSRPAPPAHRTYYARYPCASGPGGRMSPRGDRARSDQCRRDESEKICRFGRGQGPPPTSESRVI